MLKNNEICSSFVNWTIGGWVDRASATETVDTGLIPGQVKPKPKKKLVFTASLLDVQPLKGQCEASTVW